MRILFMGTPDFALKSLKALYEAKYDIIGVVTNIDKPKGRGMKLVASPVKEYALEKGLPIYQPQKVRNNVEFLEEIKKLNPDLICVVAYGKILPQELLDIPKYGCVNVHGSLLPNYRGAAPIQWAVLNGDKTTGITTMFMNAGMDTGDMLLKQEVEIGEDNLSRLHGYDVIFRSPSALPTIPEFVEEVERGALLTSEIEMVLKLAPCKVIGVTGTEGKTTTTSIIYEILKQTGRNCFLGGNIGKPIFTKVKDMRPDDIIVLELSSFQLMGMEVSPDIAVVTNMFPDHLNVHKSYEEYQEAKKNIFLHQDKNGIAILNKDNDITRNFAKDVVGKAVFFSSTKQLKDGYVYDRADQMIKHCIDGKCIELLKKDEIKLRGIHNYENICAALAATETVATQEQQLNAIKNFNGVEHRLEFVRELNGVRYYNDSIGTSPASTIAGLNAFDENIVLLAGGSDKGLDYKEIGEKISKGTTGLYGKGMYTNQDKLVLMCAASRGDVARVKQVAREIDSNSFIIIANAREVVGLGFKK